MTLTRRVIACLDVQGGRVVKGTGFRQLRDVGEPAELARRYELAGADEIVFLDVAATPNERATLRDVVRVTAEQLFVPLTVGGGVRTVDDLAAVLRAGADKVCINSAAVARPDLLSEAANRFGAQCVVASIDAKLKSEGDGWEVYVSGGRIPTGLDAVEWAERCALLGAGEILLTSIDRDGARTGYDLELTNAVSRRVSVPVVASGGAGSAAHVAEVLSRTTADAALVAGVLHDGLITIGDIKYEMLHRGLPVREMAHV